MSTLRERMATLLSDPARMPGAAPGLRGRVLVSVVLMVMVGVTAVGVILFGSTPERIAYDQDRYHVPAIRTFAAEMPTPNLKDYLSATTPGYHLALAVIARQIDDSLTTLRLSGMVFGLGLIGTLGWWVSGRAPGVGGLALCLPIAGSIYLFGPTAWVLPDNAAWWAVLGIVLLALRGRLDMVAVTGYIGLFVLLVFVRQVHVWAMGVALCAAWLGDAGSRRRGPAASTDQAEPALLSLDDLDGLFSGGAGLGDRIARVGGAVMASLPALAMLAGFVALWGGLTPPGNINPVGEDAPANFHGRLHGGNGATPALILSLVALYAPLLAAYWWRSAADLCRRGWWVMIAAALIGLVAAAVPATTYSVEAGRWTGLWNLAARLPTVMGHSSLLLLLLAPIGAAVIAAMAHGLRHRDRWIMLGTLVAFAVAQSASKESWQRYLEPMLLMLMAVMCALLAERAWSGRTTRPRWEVIAEVAGPLLLGVVLAVVGVVVS